MRLKIALWFLLSFLGPSIGFSQDILNRKLDGSEQGKPLGDFLRQIEKGNNSKFFFIDEWLEGLSFDKGYEGMTLEEALKKILLGTDISVSTLYGYAIIFVKDPNRTLEKMRFVQSIRSDKRTVESRSLLSLIHI